MLVRQIFDPKLAQYAYLIGCQKTGEALVIDPERDIDRYMEAAKSEGLEITAVAETHIHADFLSGAREFAERYGTKVYLSAEGGADWQYGWASGGRASGEGYDVTLLRDGDTFAVGNIELTAVHTPGHTPEHLSYLVVDRGGGATTPMAIASGDFVFVGDLGRPDLLEQAAGMHGVQESSARELYESLPRFTALEDHLQVWPAHGAGSACGKSLGAVPVTTVGYEKRYNASIGAAAHGEDAFVDAILEGQPEPQLYFARMKQENRDGPRVLGVLPHPERLSASALGGVLTRGDALILDTRSDRSAFMAGHLPGSYYAPLNKSFSAAVGSLITDATRPIVLIVDGARVEEAVRDLVRIGYDRIDAYAEPAVLKEWFEGGGERARIEEIDFDAVEKLMRADGTRVLDVRFATEHAAGHIRDAVNASYTRLPEYLETRVPKDATLLVHCQSGARSAVASAYLAAQGLDVKYVNDHWNAWAEGGRPVERGLPAEAPTR